KRQAIALDQERSASAATQRRSAGTDRRADGAAGLRRWLLHRRRIVAALPAGPGWVSYLAARRPRQAGPLRAGTNGRRRQALRGRRQRRGARHRSRPAYPRRQGARLALGATRAGRSLEGPAGPVRGREEEGSAVRAAARRVDAASADAQATLAARE